MTNEGKGNALTVDEREALAAGISALAGATVFSVTFLKRDGAPRTMVCRLGVPYVRKTADPANGDRGRALTYSQVRDKGLLPVFEMCGRAEVRKCFDLETLQTVRAHGQEYRPTDLA